jgi:hypothetical protein
MNNWIQRMWFLWQFHLFLFLFVGVFFVFSLFAAYFLSLSVVPVSFVCRIFACETLGGELRRMTWTLASCRSSVGT